MRGKPLVSLLGLGLAVLVLAVFGQTVGHAFLLFDDEDYVSANPHVRAGLTRDGLAWAITSFDHYNWHPLTWASHMLDAQLFGLRPGGHHATSVLLHALASVLLLLALHSMTESPWRSALAAALFAVHPLHVESVAWIAERKDVLSAVFFMLVLLAYQSYVRHPGLLRHALVTLLFALGLATKPMLVTLPFVLVLLDLWPLGRLSVPGSPSKARARAHDVPRAGPARGRTLGGIVLEKSPWLALSAASCAVTFLAQRRGGAMDPFERLPFAARAGNAALSCVLYLAQTVWPFRLSFFYPHPGERTPVGWALGAAALLIVITAAVLGQIRVRPYLAVGWLWYLGTLVPVIGLVQVGAQARADRYTYIPLIGVFIAVVWGLAEIAERAPALRRVLAPASGVTIALLAIVSCSRTRDWRDSETLFRQAIAVQPDNWLAHNDLGVALYRSGRVEEAAGHFRDSIRLQPGNSRARVNLGIALSDQGRREEALAEFSEAARIAPGNALAHYNRGVLLAAQGRSDEAMAEYAEALRRDPGITGAHNNLGGHLFELGRTAEAIEHFRSAVALEPGSVRSRLNLGIALGRAGARTEALAQFQEALRLDPSNREARSQIERLQAP